MSVIRQVIKTVCRSILPKSFFFTHGNRSTHQIALTFDDGPEPEYTIPLLDLLKEYHIPATFFVIGEKAERHPDLLKRMVAEGHVIGNHSFTHSEPRETSTQMFMDEIHKTRQLIEEISNKPCSLMRPPKGELTLRKIYQLWKTNQAVALWSVDSKDYLMHTSEEAINWAKSYQSTPGDILLIHDDQPYVCSLVETLLQNNDQSQFTTLAQWQQ